jgi:hypothetical protein
MSGSSPPRSSRVTQVRMSASISRSRTRRCSCPPPARPPRHRRRLVGPPPRCRNRPRLGAAAAASPPDRLAPAVALEDTNQQCPRNWRAGPPTPTRLPAVVGSSCQRPAAFRRRTPRFGTRLGARGSLAYVAIPSADSTTATLIGCLGRRSSGRDPWWADRRRRARVTRPGVVAQPRGDLVWASGPVGGRCRRGDVGAW